MVLMIDNYDSFTYNLVQYCGELGERVEVWRNDAITVAEIRALQPDHIILSPGPCTPNEAGVSLAVVRELAGVVPILGVCLGHQTIGQAFGGKIIHAREVMPPQHRSFSRPRQPVHRNPLSLAGDRAGEFSGVPRNYRLDSVARRGARRNNGRAASRIAGVRCAIPSRVHPHRTWPRPAPKFL